MTDQYQKVFGLEGKRCDDKTPEIQQFESNTQVNVQENLTAVKSYHNGEVDEEDVAMNPEHIELFKSMFCFLKKPGKYYEYETGVQYTELEFINRNKMEETVVRYFSKAKMRTVTRRYESARLWIKNHKQDIERFYDLSYVTGGCRVIPHPKGPKYGDLLNAWKRNGVTPEPNGDCSLFYEWFQMLLPDEATREWILDTMAYKYHHPREKPGVCIQLCGKAQGIGKSFLCATLCEALFGRDVNGGTFLQLNGTKKEQFKGELGAHLSRSDVVMVDELSREKGMKSIYEKVKKLIADETGTARDIFKDYKSEESFMLWLMTTNHKCAIPIESTEDRQQFIARCEDGFLHLPDPQKFVKSFKHQMYFEGGMGKLVSDIKSRPLRAQDRSDGLDFKPSVVALFPKEVREERAKMFAELREGTAEGTADEPSEDPFFATLAEEVHDRSFTEKFLRSRKANVNGIHAFDWLVLAQNKCHHETSKSLYDEYKRQRGDNITTMSMHSFSRRLAEVGLFKAQKRVKNEKKTDVVWVGFKRPRVSPPPSLKREGLKKKTKRVDMKGRGGKTKLDTDSGLDGATFDETSISDVVQSTLRENSFIAENEKWVGTRVSGVHRNDGLKLIVRMRCEQDPIQQLKPLDVEKWSLL